jgi:hypothetical protein
MTDITNSDKALSSTELKATIGRNTFIRTKHTGGTGDPTAHEATRRLDAKAPKQLSWLEKLRLRNDNPSLYNALKGAGWSDDQIFKHLNTL